MQKISRRILWPSMMVWERIDNKNDPQRFIGCLCFVGIPGIGGITLPSSYPLLGGITLAIYLYNIFAMFEFRKYQREQTEIMRKLNGN